MDVVEVSDGAAGTEPDSADSCTLERSEVPQRLAEWDQVLRGNRVDRDSSGAIVELARDVDLTHLVALIEAETRCCSFFTFDLRVEATRRRLRITAPVGQQHMIDALVGSPS